MGDLERSIYQKSDGEIDDLYEIYQEEIEKEQWLHCPPHFYHISEFDEALKSQLNIDLSYAPNESMIEMIQRVKDFYDTIKKNKVDELTLKEKEILYYLSHGIIY